MNLIDRAIDWLDDKSPRPVRWAWQAFLVVIALVALLIVLTVPV